MSVALVIKYSEPTEYFDESTEETSYYNEDKEIILDTINDVSVTVSSEMTEYPTVSGIAFSDHMYTKPAEMSVTGSFSLNGKKGLVSEIGAGRLAPIQEVFENIKDSALLCDISKISFRGSGQNAEIDATQFIERKSMALVSITWTERINSVDFEFSFKQAMLSTIQEYDVDWSDEYAANISTLDTYSFTDVLNNTIEMITYALIAVGEAGLLTNEFLESYINEYGTSLSYLNEAGIDWPEGFDFSKLINICEGVSGAIFGTAGVTAAIVGSILIKTTFGVVGAALSATGVGLVVIGAIAIVGAIFAFLAASSSKYIYDEFDKVPISTSEADRFTQFLADMYEAASQYNDDVTVYKLANDIEQEALVSLDGTYYSFNFKKNNTSGLYYLEVYDMNDSLVASYNECQSCPSSYSFCSDDNVLFYTENNKQRVFLVCSSEDDRNNLENYYIYCTAQNPQNFAATITNLVENALVK